MTGLATGAVLFPGGNGECERMAPSSGEACDLIGRVAGGRCAAQVPASRAVRRQICLSAKRRGLDLRSQARSRQPVRPDDGREPNGGGNRPASPVEGGSRGDFGRPLDAVPQSFGRPDGTQAPREFILQPLRQAFLLPAPDGRAGVPAICGRDSGGRPPCPASSRGPRRFRRRPSLRCIAGR